MCGFGVCITDNCSLKQGSLLTVSSHLPAWCLCWTTRIQSKISHKLCLYLFVNLWHWLVTIHCAHHTQKETGIYHNIFYLFVLEKYCNLWSIMREIIVLQFFIKRINSERKSLLAKFSSFYVRFDHKKYQYLYRFSSPNKKKQLFKCIYKWKKCLMWVHMLMHSCQLLTYK